ncbi:MAG: hypothetical protein H6728_11320 [Myxococcales bacterium]|nr:hypothetical protein [Myxococcales bacterium]MCB9643652.1 hypothetical protein [Myxococcales bacterium]
MDKYRKALEFDVRLLKRDIRHHLRSGEAIEEQRRALPESNLNEVNWFNQDGDICSDEETRAVEKLHKDGWQHLFDWNKIQNS